MLAVASDAMGNAYVAGTVAGTFEFGSFAGKSVGPQDALVAKLAPDGTLAWAKLWSGDRKEYATSIALGPGGSVLVGGSAESTGGTDFGGGKIGASDLVSGPFFVELTNGGDHVCSRSYPAGRPLPSDAQVAVSGASTNAVVAATPTSFAAGGSFAATLDLGKGPMTSKGGYDLWIADFTR
jgi:hypothetical protein